MSSNPYSELSECQKKRRRDEVIAKYKAVVNNENVNLCIGESSSDEQHVDTGSLQNFGTARGNFGTGSYNSEPSDN